MGVVHHSNYLRIFEDARVDWLRESGLGVYHAPQADLFMAVLESECEHLKPARLGDLLEVFLQVRMERLKTRFRYVIFKSGSEELIARGVTLHIPLTSQLKVTRPPKGFLEGIEREKWTETWP